MGQESFLSPRMVVMGCIGAPYGVKGWVHVQSFTEPVGNLLSYKTWYLCKNAQWQEISVKSARIHGNGIIAALEGCDTREAAATWNHAEIGILREALPTLEPGEYYWTDLIGMSVVTKEGECLGKVKDLLETGSNDVLIVKGELKEHLIPYVPQDYILQVDVEARCIHVDWDPEF